MSGPYGPSGGTPESGDGGQGWSQPPQQWAPPQTQQQWAPQPAQQQWGPQGPVPPMPPQPAPPQAAQPQPGQQQWGQGQWGPLQQWNQQPQTAAPAEPGHRPHKALLIGAAVTVIVIAVVALVATLVALGSKNTLDRNAVQAGVQRVLKESYGISDVQDVSCPSGQRVDVGRTFECTMRVGSDQKRVSVRITKSDGTYEVGRPN